MDFDINPFHSSLFTGQGTAWGPATYGKPADAPSAPSATKPSDYQAFDQTPLVKQLQAQMKAKQATNTVGAQRQANAMGAGGSDAARAINQNIASQSQQDQNAVQYEAAKEAFNSQVQQQQTADQQALARYQAALDQYKLNQGNYLAEKGARNSALGAFGPIASQY